MRKVIFNNGNIDIDILQDLILRDCKEIKTLFSLGFERESFTMPAFFDKLKEIISLVSWDSKAIDGIENDFITLIPFHVDFNIISFPSKNDLDKLRPENGMNLTLENCIVVDLAIFFNLKLDPKFK